MDRLRSQPSQLTCLVIGFAAGLAVAAGAYFVFAPGSDRRGAEPADETASVPEVVPEIEVAAPRPPSPPWTVGQDGTATYSTIQSAVDAAPPGTEIRIGPGTYDEHVVVNRPLTLVGSGADRTIVTSEIEPPAGDRPDPRDPSGFESSARPTVRVDGAINVVLRDLKLTGRADKLEGRIRRDAVLLLRRSVARVQRCVIADTGASGLYVGSGSSAEIEDCLLSDIRSEGVIVRGDQVAIRRCEIRRIGHYGISIAPGSRAHVEGCWISGCLWHGIRYDDASPVIVGNRIFRNTRCGIYASGSTAGRIEGNLFLENGMGGVSCWFASRDTVQRNSFARNTRDGLAVLGASQPRIEANIFWENKLAILGGHVASKESTGNRFTSLPDVSTNWFWKNEKDLELASPGAPQTLIQSDPGFADGAGGDFALLPDSPALRAGVGADRAPPARSPWKEP